MKRVYKYDLPFEDWPEIEMQRDADIVHVHEQNGTIKLWAVIDDQITETSTRQFRIAGTGHPLDLASWQMRHLGSVHMSLCLVFHIFEVFHA